VLLLLTLLQMGAVTQMLLQEPATLLLVRAPSL
jgi:hypothetical protein